MKDNNAEVKELLMEETNKPSLLVPLILDAVLNTAVFLVLLVLKLTGLSVIEISWFWVFFPLWYTSAIMAVIFIIFFITFLIAEAIKNIKNKKGE